MEQTFDNEELIRIIKSAELFQEISIRRDEIEGSSINDLLDDAPNELEGNRFDISMTYDVTESLGIKREYVDRAIRLLHPSIDEQLRQLKEHSALPAFYSVIVDRYKNNLTRTLEEAFPMDKFKVKHRFFIDGYFSIDDKRLSFYRVKKGRILNGKEKWADVKFYFGVYNTAQRFGVAIVVYNHSFLSACRDTFSSLKTEFDGHLGEHKTFYHYKV